MKLYARREASLKKLEDRCRALKQDAINEPHKKPVKETLAEEKPRFRKEKEGNTTAVRSPALNESVT